MLRVGLLLFSFVTALGLRGQVIVTGSVVNAGDESVVGASVVLYRGQSAVIGEMGLTDETGNFYLTMADSLITDTWLIVRSLGYLPDTTLLSPGQEVTNLRIRMSTTGYRLDDIVVNESRNGIEVRGDSVFFRVSRFTTDSLETMSSVLRSLPGIMEDADGNYFYQGTPVRDILLDDDNFVSSQGKQLLEVLRSGDVLDVGVQPSTDRGNDRRTVDINLLTKRERAGALFGDVSASAGLSLRGRGGVEGTIGLVRTGDSKLFLNGQARTIGNPGLTLYDYLSMTGGAGVGDRADIPSVFTGRMPMVDYTLFLAGINGSKKIRKDWRFAYGVLGFSNRHEQRQDRQQFNEGSLLLRTATSAERRPRFATARVSLAYEPAEKVAFTSQIVYQAAGSRTDKQSFTELRGLPAIDVADAERSRSDGITFSSVYLDERRKLQHQVFVTANVQGAEVRRHANTSAEAGIPFTRLFPNGPTGLFREAEVAGSHDIDIRYRSVYEIKSRIRVGGQLSGRLREQSSIIDRTPFPGTDYTTRSQTLGLAVVAEQDMLGGEGQVSGALGVERQNFLPGETASDPVYYPTLNLAASIPLPGGANIRVNGDYRQVPFLLTTPPGFYNFQSPSFAIRSLALGNRRLGQASGTVTYSRADAGSGRIYSLFLRGLSGKDIASVQQFRSGLVVNEEVVGDNFMTLALGGNLFIRRAWSRNTKLSYFTTRYQVRLPNRGGATVNWRHRLSLQQKFAVAEVPFTLGVTGESQHANTGVRASNFLTTLEHLRTYGKWEVEASAGAILQIALGQWYARPVAEFNLARRWGAHWSLTGGFSTYAQSLLDAPQTVFLRQEQAYVTQRQLPPAVAFLGCNYRL